MTAILDTHGKLLLTELSSLFTSNARGASFSNLLTHHFGSSPSDCLSEQRLGGCARSKIFVLVTALLDNLDHPSVGRLTLALEMLHQCTLVVDDIEDDALYRRGRPTLWSSCGVSPAINLSYWLLFSALDRIAASFETAEAFRAATKTALHIVNGQSQDQDADWGRNYDSYKQVSSEKTGRLYAFSALLACKLAGHHNGELSNSLETLMLGVGTCHQICDDLADASTLESNKKVFGEGPAIVKNVRQSVFSVGGRPVSENESDVFDYVTSQVESVKEWLRRETKEVQSQFSHCRSLLLTNHQGEKVAIWEEDFAPLVDALTTEENAL